MFTIPRAPLLLGLAGLLPFIAGAVIATGLFWANKGDPQDGGFALIAPRDGVSLLSLYGTIILSFMSGVLWGFATKAEGAQATTGYILSVLPALWTLFMRGGSDHETLQFLIIGFLGLLALDYYFFRQNLTPVWWMRLRILLTTIVLACLGIGALA
ncbi:DUF3429 domain-containing protein [Sulfitobacter sp. HNIBRBA2951]|uniref:DUF3429 domain-containing protein n=1 Tax=Sulfitobacter aquimarinus TaxID=3158557 RepID=UPI0032DEF9A7